MNTDATAERIERETEREQAHGASWPTRRRNHRVLWIVLFAVLVGVAVGIVTHA